MAKKLSTRQADAGVLQYLPKTSSSVFSSPTSSLPRSRISHTTPRPKWLSSESPQTYLAQRQGCFRHRGAQAKATVTHMGEDVYPVDLVDLSELLV